MTSPAIDVPYESRTADDRLGMAGTFTVTVLDADTGAVLSEQTVENTACIGWARWGADQFMTTAQPDVPTRMELGTGSDTPAYLDEQVSGKAGTTDVAAVERSTESEVFIGSFLDSTEMNGFSLTRLGVLTDSGHLLNHAAIATVNKTQSKVVNLQATLGLVQPTP